MDAIEDQTFSIVCNATGKPVPEYTWIKDKTQENVADSDRFHVNPQTGLLQISSVRPEDYSTYTCRAKNSAGESHSNMLLNVLERPRIYELINVTTSVKLETRIVCKASGRPPPDITFRRWAQTEEYIVGQQPSDDRVILEQFYDRDSGRSNATLIVSSVLRTDDGLYECVARNRGGDAFKVGHIAVEYPPNFEHMVGLPPVFSWQERRANLSCLASGIPNATIEWWFNSRLISEQFDNNFEIQGSGPRSDLLVRPKGQRYYAPYKCVAKNRLGHAEHIMELREARIPDAVIQANPRIVTATTITFDIIGPASEMPILAFSGQYKEDRSPDWSTAGNRTWSPGSPYIIEGLRPHTAYQFR